MSQPLGVIRLERNGPAETGMAETPRGPEAFEPSSRIPVERTHVYFEDEEKGFSVGVWNTDTMQEAFGPYPGDEFIWVLDGEFKMLDGDGNAVHCPNDSCVSFRNAAPVSWLQEGFLKKFYITYTDPKADTPHIVSAQRAIQVLDPNVDLETMDNTEPFETEGEVPVQKNHTNFTNDAGTFFTGTWESGPMVSKMRPFPTHEFVRMLEGEVTITEKDGSAQTFVGGDCFFVPKGTECRWEIKDRVKKHYAILDV